MNDKILRYMENVNVITDCIVAYSTPLYIVGEFNPINALTTNVISATMPKTELEILNNKYPNWLLQVFANANNENNILILKDFDKITEEEQSLFIDLICENQVSTKELPDNFKLIINAEKRCPLISKISDVIQYIEM